MRLLDIDLPAQGITLQCRQAGTAGAPRVLLLHGFPEAAFVWDEVMAALADRAWLLAPDQRGYGGSSHPAEVSAYRGRHLVADLAELCARSGGPMDLVVAHDWGGAVAWSLAALHPGLVRRLLILNAPHAGPLLRALREDPQQQAASAYMNRLCEPGMAARLAENDFARLWRLFEQSSPCASGPGGWLTEPLRERYRAVWRQGLDGALNWYRASPLRPPQSPQDPLMSLQLPPELLTVRVPTRVLWGLDDEALRPCLLDGLADWVPDLRVERIPGASHWIVHEQPQRVVAAITQALAGG